MSGPTEHHEAVRQLPAFVDWLEGLGHDGPFERVLRLSVEHEAATQLEAAPS
jgi:hypothetical protein